MNVSLELRAFSASFLWTEIPQYRELRRLLFWQRCKKEREERARNRAPSEELANYWTVIDLRVSYLKSLSLSQSNVSHMNSCRMSMMVWPDLRRWSSLSCD